LADHSISIHTSVTGVGIPGARLAYTDGMKIILAMLVCLMFVACNSPESENLKKENADLKAQLEVVTKERDALKVQMDSIKAVLENASGTTSTTPDPSNPDATTPATADPSATTGSDMGATTPNSTTPEASTPSSSGSSSTPSTTPSTDGSSTTTITPDSGATSTASSAVERYAKDVLETAKKYNDETQQTPPADCSSGYTAGTHAVPSSDAIASCRVDRVEKGFRITLKDANGAVTTLSDAVAKP
jgi:hypothetical protein